MHVQIEHDCTTAEVEALGIGAREMLRAAIVQIGAGLREHAEGKAGAMHRIDRGYELAKLADSMGQG